MKYLKTYEKIRSIKKRELEEGDYVIIDDNTDLSKKYNDFFKTHILQIEEIHGKHIFAYPIIENDESDEIKNEFNFVHPFKIDDIKFYGDNIEELKLKMVANKYNL